MSRLPETRPLPHVLWYRPGVRIYFRPEHSANGLSAIPAFFSELQPVLTRLAGPAMAYRLIDSPAVDVCSDAERGDRGLRIAACQTDGSMPDSRDKDDDRGRAQDDDPEEAPETPTDEPQPVPVQDPPAEPDPSPYVVRALRADREEHK